MTHQQSWLTIPVKGKSYWMHDCKCNTCFPLMNAYKYLCNAPIIKTNKMSLFLKPKKYNICHISIYYKHLEKSFARPECRTTQLHVLNTRRWTIGTRKKYIWEFSHYLKIQWFLLRQKLTLARIFNLSLYLVIKTHIKSTNVMKSNVLYCQM